jgi:phosphoribosylpyrophosphate synthetase
MLMLSPKLQSYLPKFFLCPGCRHPTHQVICASCERLILRNTQILCSHHESIQGIAPLVYAFETTQAIIRKWKEYRGSQLQRILFQVPEVLRTQLIKLHFFAIVPIPQNQKRSFARGQDSAFEIAQCFSKSLDLPILPLLELQHKNPERQTGLGHFDREFSKNPFQIHTQFGWNSPLFRRMEEKVLNGEEIRILLVDDLITSGSTLTKSAMVIQSFLPRSKIWAGSIGYRPKSNRVLAHVKFR